MAAGEYKALGNSWNDARTMAVMGGSIWSICQGTLYKVDKEGQYTSIGDGWNGTTAMIAMDKNLFVIDAGTLYKVDVA